MRVVGHHWQPVTFGGGPPLRCCLGIGLGLRGDIFAQIVKDIVKNLRAAKTSLVSKLCLSLRWIHVKIFFLIHNPNWILAIVCGLWYDALVLPLYYDLQPTGLFLVGPIFSCIYRSPSIWLIKTNKNRLVSDFKQLTHGTKNSFIILHVIVNHPVPLFTVCIVYIRLCIFLGKRCLSLEFLTIIQSVWAINRCFVCLFVILLNPGISGVFLKTTLGTPLGVASLNLNLYIYGHYHYG